MAPMLRTGKIQVDQVASIARGEFAGYRATAGAGGTKGDTVMVPAALDINDVGHRSVVIHELTHAGQDAGVTGAQVQTLDRERSEMEAYRAGARYQLQELGGMSMFVRPAAVRQIGVLLNEISLMALMLESRADPAMYEPFVLQANQWWNHRLPEADIRRALQASDFKIERAMFDVIGRLYGSRDATTGARIPGGNEFPADKLSGESILDWIDRV